MDTQPFITLLVTTATPPFSSSLLIREHPLALSTTDGDGDIPLQDAIAKDRPDPIISLLADATSSLAISDYAALAARVHGDVHAIRRLCLTPAQLAVRVTLLLCLKHSHETFFYERDGDHACSGIIFSYL